MTSHWRLALVLCLAAASSVSLHAIAADPTTEPSTKPTLSAEPNPRLNEPLSIFGIGSDAQHTKDLPKWIPEFTKIGVHNMRDAGGTGWVGKLHDNWDGLGAKLVYVESQGTVTGTFLYNYRRDKGKNGLPMDDLAGWTAHVSQLVSHTKGHIKYFESWNEPPNGTAKGQTAVDYAKYMIATYDAAKKANPDAMIGMACQSAHINYLDQAIKAGAKDHFDYITLHPYETLGVTMSVSGAEPMFMNIVPAVRKMLAATNPEKLNVPIWLTEIGYDAKKDGSRQNIQAAALLKTYTMGIAQGITCIDWFECKDGDSGPMGLLRGDGTPRPAFIAYSKLIESLGQQPEYLGWVLLNDRNYAFVFKGDKQNVLLTWAPKGASDDIDFGESVEIIEPLTGKSSKADKYELTDMPIIVNGAPTKFVDLAKANKPKPFPWGGDYTDAKSVSVTMGEKNIEKGLHTHSGDSIAADVIAYGGNARVGTMAGGNVFIVDPNFLTYTSTPIEISVVCRRNPKNEPAKLRIEYESTQGYKKTTEYVIPDNTEWHTATWKITDSQFVGKWGFNFRMDAGKYYVQSVTVTKLEK
ncbi:hypothetical protein BH10PLA1_BH10PLA1_09860 [soil metagenome]